MSQYLLGAVGKIELVTFFSVKASPWVSLILRDVSGVRGGGEGGGHPPSQKSHIETSPKVNKTDTYERNNFSDNIKRECFSIKFGEKVHYWTKMCPIMPLKPNMYLN